MPQNEALNARGAEDMDDRRAVPTSQAARRAAFALAHEPRFVAVAQARAQEHVAARSGALIRVEGALMERANPFGSRFPDSKLCNARVVERAVYRACFSRRASAGFIREMTLSMSVENALRRSGRR